MGNETSFTDGLTGAFVREAFARLGLPLPEKEEYLGTSDGGRLVLVDPAACAVRVSLKKSLDVFDKGASRHDRLLQPLGRLEDDDVIVDVNPGILVPGLRKVRYYQDESWCRQVWENRQDLGADLPAGGYIWEDNNPFNVGYLPGTQTREQPRGFAVVLDPGFIQIDIRQGKFDPYRCERELRSRGETAAIELLRQKAATEDFFKRHDAPVQDALYADLRQAFARAVQGEDKAQFWKACAAAKEAGRLVNDWHDVAYDEAEGSPAYYATPKKLPRISDAYAKRLTQHPGFSLGG